MSTSQHIFLSYSREDSDIMQRIRTNLQRVGLKIWSGAHIEPGSEQWKKEVPKAIRDAGVVVVLMSPRSNHSEWVEREITIAKSVDIEILPLMIDGEVHQALLPALADMEYIDLRDDYEGNIIQVIRLCYEFRQQDDVRTTAELRQAMTTETDNVEEIPIEAPKSDNQDVKMFVRHIADRDDRPIKKLGKTRNETEQPSSLRLIMGIGLLVAGLVGGILVIVFVFNPFASDSVTATAVVANNTEVTEAVEPTIDSQIVEPTVMDEPTATNEPPTDEPTATNEPPTDEPIDIPTATNEPLDISTATNEPPTDEPEPSATSQVEPTAIAPTATNEPTAIPTATATPLPPSPTLVPTAIPVTDGNIELVYNGDTLIVHNIDDTPANLTGVQFILVGETAEDSILFLAEEWSLTNNALRPERCTQLWRVEFSELPAGQPPADECAARSAFRSTPRTFWIVDGDKTVFEIRRDGAVLVQCQAAIRDDNELLRCMVNI